MKMISDKTDETYCKETGRDGSIGPERESLMHGRDSVVEQALPGRYHATVTIEEKNGKCQPLVIDEETYNEMFENSREFDADGFEGFPQEEMDCNQEGSTTLPEERGSGVDNPNRQFKRKWDRALNKLVMKCYIMGEPNRRGFRKRMHNAWQDIGVFDLTEQQLAGQVLHLKNSKYFADIEIEEMKRETKEKGEHWGIDDDDDVVEPIVTYATNGDDIRQIEVDVEDENDVDGDILERIKCKLALENLEKVDLKSYDRRKVREATSRVNGVIGKLKTTSITDTNRLILVGANVVGDLVGVKSRGEPKTKEPWWKRRIQGKISELRKDISHLEEWNKERMSKERIKNNLEHKYSVKKKGLKVVIEELKQKGKG